MWLKLEGPAIILTFPGILLETILMELQLPREKLEELKELITKWLMRNAGRKEGVAITNWEACPCDKDYCARMHLVETHAGNCAQCETLGPPGSPKPGVQTRFGMVALLHRNMKWA